MLLLLAFEFAFAVGHGWFEPFPVPFPLPLPPVRPNRACVPESAVQPQGKIHGNSCFRKCASGFSVGRQYRNKFIIFPRQHLINGIDGLFISVKPSISINISDLVIIIGILVIIAFIAIPFLVILVVVKNVGIVIVLIILIEFLNRVGWLRPFLVEQLPR